MPPLHTIIRKFSILAIKKLTFGNEMRLEKFVFSLVGIFLDYFRLIAVFKWVWCIVIYILILRLFLKMRFFYA